jgi:excinuclease UvrABC ATPase subunit
MFEGVPEDLAEQENSYTGKFLKKAMEQKTVA